jgi:hypothetical protein
VRIYGNGNRNVCDGTDKGPDKAGYDGSPAAKNLHGQGNTVDVGDVVSYDGESENDEAEIAKLANVRNEDGVKETTDSGFRISVRIDVDAAVDGGDGDDDGTEDLTEQKREDQSSKGGEEHTDSVCGYWLVAGIIGSI